MQYLRNRLVYRYNLHFNKWYASSWWYVQCSFLYSSKSKRFFDSNEKKTEWIEACERSVSNGQQPIIPCEDLRSRYMELVVANLVFGAVSFVLNVSFAVQLWNIFRRTHFFSSIQVLGCTWGFQLCTHKHYSVAKHEDDYGSGAVRSSINLSLFSNKILLSFSLSLQASV